MREALALQKLFTFFQWKILAYIFEELGPDVCQNIVSKMANADQDQTVPTVLFLD